MDTSRTGDFDVFLLLLRDGMVDFVDDLTLFVLLLVEVSMEEESLSSAENRSSI